VDIKGREGNIVSYIAGMQLQYDMKPSFLCGSVPLPPSITKTSTIMATVAMIVLLQCPKCFAGNKEQADNLWQRAVSECEKLSTQDAALKHINQAISLDPTRANLWQWKAIILERLEESEQALPMINKAIELDPKDAASWATKADILCSLKKYDEALISVDKGLKFTNAYNSHITKAEILRHLRKFDLAEKELDILIAQRPKDDIVRSRRADVARMNQHWQKVIEDTSFVIKMRVLSFSHWNLLERRAEAYVQTKQYDKAIADYKEGIRNVPDARQTHDALLKVYTITGNAKGVAAERRAIESIDKDL
jgi:tetratricopeptide (TPR) repeat protein